MVALDELELSAPKSEGYSGRDLLAKPVTHEWVGVTTEISATAMRITVDLDHCDTCNGRGTIETPYTDGLGQTIKRFTACGDCGPLGPGIRR